MGTECTARNQDWSGSACETDENYGTSFQVTIVTDSCGLDNCGTDGQVYAILKDGHKNPAIETGKVVMDKGQDSENFYAGRTSTTTLTTDLMKPGQICLGIQNPDGGDDWRPQSVTITNTQGRSKEVVFSDSDWISTDSGKESERCKNIPSW